MERRPPRAVDIDRVMSRDRRRLARARATPGPCLTRRGSYTAPRYIAGRAGIKGTSCARARLTVREDR